MPDPTVTDHVAAYDRQSARLAAEYEALLQAPHRDGFDSLLSPGAGRVALDVGAGSGRDAAWFARLGFEVVAVEPSAGMRTEGGRLHGDAGIRWLDDRLPALDATHGLGLSFDVVLLSAVWQHVAPADRARAFRKLATLLRPGGLLVITLRHGPAPPDRPMHEVSLGEVEALAGAHGLSVARATRRADTRGRAGVDWTVVAMTLPDDGTGALPLLRGIVLNDDKSATYKLGLLRAVAKVADLSPSLGRPHAVEDLVELPLGAVALNWVRMYLPLVARGLPQTPRNSGPDGLGFARAGFRAVMSLGIAPADLRVGAAFSGERAAAVAAALVEACRTIATMPANFTRYPNSPDRVFRTSRSRTALRPALVLDRDALEGFGTLVVPGHVWRAMQRLGPWIEPVLSAEWARMVRGYADRQGAVLAPGEVEAALAWVEPVRDVRVAREVALASMTRGDPLACVWSGRPLTPATLDVDHCLPWSAWPCGDLWNLLPAHRTVNQREKRDLLPSGPTLEAARASIVDWWGGAWLGDPALGARFGREAAAALPVPRDASGAAVFEGLAWRRLRLQQDQRLPEWSRAPAGQPTR